MIISIANTLIPDDFQQFAKNAVNKRERKVIKKKKLSIDVLSEFIQLFKNTSTYLVILFIFCYLRLKEKKEELMFSLEKAKGEYKWDKKEFEPREPEELERRKIRIDNEIKTSKKRES